MLWDHIDDRVLNQGAFTIIFLESFHVMPKVFDMYIQCLKLIF